MVRKIDELFAQVMELDQSSRAEFAERLLDSINSEPALTEIELEWLKEAEDRSAAYHRGEVETFSGEEVLAELESDSRKSA